MMFRSCFEQSSPRSTPTSSKNDLLSPASSEETATETDESSICSDYPPVDLFLPLEKETLVRALTEETSADEDSSLDYSDRHVSFALDAPRHEEDDLDSPQHEEEMTPQPRCEPPSKRKRRGLSRFWFNRDREDCKSSKQGKVPPESTTEASDARDALDSSLSSRSDTPCNQEPTAPPYDADDFDLSSSSESDTPNRVLSTPDKPQEYARDVLDSSLSSTGSETCDDSLSKQVSFDTCDLSKQVSFEDEVSVRVYSDSPPPQPRSSQRPPRHPKSQRRRRAVSCDDQSLYNNRQESTSRQVNSSLYLDSMSERVDDLKHVLVRRQIKYGTKHPWTGHVWLYVGGYYFSTHNFDKAEHAFLQAAECDEGDHPNVEGGYIVAEAFSNLGVIYWNIRNTEKAVQSLEVALSWHDTNETSRGRDPDACLAIAHCLDKLSMACTLHGSLDKAQRALVHCAHIHNQIGSDRLEVARIMDRLGMVHMHAEDLDESMSCYTKALHEKQQVGGKHHPSLVSTYQHIAMIHMAQGRYKEAENVLLYALSIQDLEWKKKRKQEKNQATRLCYEMAETLQSLGQAFRAQDKMNRCYKTIVDARTCYLEAGLEDDHAKLEELRDLEHNLRCYRNQQAYANPL